MREQDPYGWVQWYCRFYKGRRIPDDERQIKRWLAFAGPKGRFKKRLINMIKKRKLLTMTTQSVQSYVKVYNIGLID